MCSERGAADERPPRPAASPVPRDPLVRHERRGPPLGDPDGPPTGRQLLVLWHAGALALVLPDPWNQFSKAQAAGAIDYVRSDDA